MDFIVYVVVLVIYTNVILSGSTSAVNTFGFEKFMTEGPTSSEIFLAVYVTVSAVNMAVGSDDRLPSAPFQYVRVSPFL